MKEQPEALRLAAALDAYWGAENGHDRERQAAAELRRLSIENEAFGLHLSERMKDLARVEAQRDALLEALRTLLSYATTLEMRFTDADGEHRAMQQARAAIAKAEGEQA